MNAGIVPERLHSEAEDLRPEINMSRIQVGGGAAGFIFAVASVYIFLVGVPALRWFFPFAIALGVVISVALRLFHRYRPTRPITPISS
jgi:hypothetical protein